MAQIAAQPAAKRHYVDATCGGCGAGWTGITRCHCSGSKSVSVDLLPVGDGDAQFLANRYPGCHKSPVDIAGVPAKQWCDLVGAQSAVVQPRRLLDPSGAMFEVVVPRGEWTKILWSVVGPGPIEMVNFVLSGDVTAEDSMLIGFDVRAPSDSPTEQDVSVLADIPTRLVFRHLLSAGKRSNRSPVAEPTARGTVPLLGSTWNGPTASSTDDHAYRLAVTALCHRLFSGITAFDAHRKAAGGKCLDPATLKKPQELVDGIWGYPLDEKGREYFESRRAAKAAR